MIQPGTLLADRYRVLRVLGEGGMGVVVEAQNTATQRHVALKWLHPHIANNREASERLVREATAVCRIRHPNVVDVYDVVRDGSSLFLVMELLEGETFREVLLRGGLPIPELLALLIPAMRGVAEAHRCGVIHRDIHPANIFLVQSAIGGPAVAKILDFGISKIGDEVSGHPPLTRSGMTMGNPAYMSLEQLYTPREVDVRTDVYSFGVVLYEAITGQLPFDGETFAEIAVKIVNGSPVPPKQIRADIPSSLEKLVLRTMASKREERIASMDELGDELERFASEQGFRAQMTEPSGPVPRAGAQHIPLSAPASRTPSPGAPAQPAPAEAAPLVSPTLADEARSADPAAPTAGIAAPSVPPARAKTKPGLLWAPLGVLAIGAVLALSLHGRDEPKPERGLAPAPPSVVPAPQAPQAAAASTAAIGTVESTLKVAAEVAPDPPSPKPSGSLAPALPAKESPAKDPPGQRPATLPRESNTPRRIPAPQPVPTKPPAHKDPRAGRLKLEQLL
jgi:serine/threonine-protein kinase